MVGPGGILYLVGEFRCEAMLSGTIEFSTVVRAGNAGLDQGAGLVCGPGMR